MDIKMEAGQLGTGVISRGISKLYDSRISNPEIRNLKMDEQNRLGANWKPRVLFRYTRRMESLLAREAKEAAIESVRKLSPEERLTAFLTHCELMARLYSAGRLASSRVVRVAKKSHEDR